MRALLLGLAVLLMPAPTLAQDAAFPMDSTVVVSVELMRHLEAQGDLLELQEEEIGEYQQILCYAISRLDEENHALVMSYIRSWANVVRMSHIVCPDSYP